MHRSTHEPVFESAWTKNLQQGFAVTNLVHLEIFKFRGQKVSKFTSGELLGFTALIKQNKLDQELMVEKG